MGNNLHLPFFWIDAFTDKLLGGNPCAVVLGADALSAQKMQAIAREMNLSETAFVTKSEKADFGARYFTPQGELPFAGHPTLSTVHALICEGLIKLSDGTNKTTLEVPAGIIPIEIFTVSGSDKHKITMLQLAPKFLRTYDPADVLPLFGLSEDDAVPKVPIQTVSTGTPILMIPLRDIDCVRRVKYVDPEAYYRFRKSGDFYFPHHFCLGGVTPVGHTFARSPGIPPEGLEDPFTGSATGCMAAYLWKYNLISHCKFIAEQGHWMDRPGSAEVEIVGNRENILTVRLQGEAATLIRGEIQI